MKFLSTLSLRRATTRCNGILPGSIHFYPRSPCGERLDARLANLAQAVFLSTLSLRRATRGLHLFHLFQLISIHALLAESDLPTALGMPKIWISIHALLAESDATARIWLARRRYFYPRSPCGERHCTSIGRPKRLYFYPRSPCGERLNSSYAALDGASISIHALLAESDRLGQNSFPVSRHYFYPRSPCGERQ